MAGAAAPPLFHARATPPLATVFALFIFIPPLPFYFGWAPSYGPGTLLGCLMAYGLMFGATEPGGRRDARLAGRIIIPWLSVSGAALLFIAGHLLVAGLLQPVDFARPVPTALSLPVLLLGGWSVAIMIAAAPPDTLVPTARLLAFALLGMGVMAALGAWPEPPTGQSFVKPVFPFSEPSLLVLALMPLYAIAVIGSRGATRYLLLTVGPLVVLSLESLTLAVGWLLVAAVCARAVLAPFALAAGIWGLSFLNLRYFLDRLDFSGTDNLSALVFIQGWELMFESLGRSQMWGLGFQQLGVHGTEAASSYLIFALLQSDSNLLDGGFVAAKLVSEFGILGIGITILLVVLGARSFLVLRRMAASTEPPRQTDLFIHGVRLAFLVELMVRGTGYFTGSIVLLIAALVLRFTHRPAPAGVAVDTRRAS